MLEIDTIISTLQIRKQYGKMVQTSPFVNSICKVAEKCLRVINVEGKIVQTKSPITLLIHKTFHNLPVNVLSAFGEHVVNDDPLNNHGIELIKLILKTF